MSQRRVYIALLIISTMLQLTFSQNVYNLDDSVDNKCGQTIKFNHDEEIILKSSGRTPKDHGFCSSIVYALGKDNKKCHGMCFSVESQFINVCLAKAQFKGLAFGEDDDPFKELSCFGALPKEWCFTSNALSVEIAENHFYAFNYTKRNYNFSVKVAPICDDSPFGKDIKAREDARREDEGSARDRSRNHGILVGVCLAVMFLIILLITWCYYQNKPFRRDIHNYPRAHVHKGPSFAGFKAKMTFHKASSNAEEGEAKPKKEKKVKPPKDEAATENEEAKPKKRGLRFLNKLRSNKAEEVPLVEKKEDQAADDLKPDDKIEEIKEDGDVVEKTSENVDENAEKEIQKTDEVDETKNSDDKEEVQGEKEDKSGDDVPEVTVTTPSENDDDKKESSNDS